MALTIRSQFLALIALTGLGLLIAHLIVTDAEAIEALAERTARAANERDFETLGQALSADFAYGGRDRAATLAHVESLLRRFPATGIEVHLHEIRVDGGRATAKGVVAARVGAQPVRVRVDLELVETEDGWKLSKASGGEGYGR